MTFYGITHNLKKGSIYKMIQRPIHPRNGKPILSRNESEQITFLVGNRKLDLPFRCMGGNTNRTDIKGRVHYYKILKIIRREVVV
jgi:hypothetical protein